MFWFVWCKSNLDTKSCVKCHVQDLCHASPLKLCCPMKCSSLFFKIKTWQNTWINSFMAFWNLSTKSQIYLSSKNEGFDKLCLELLMMQSLIVHWKRKNSIQLSIHYVSCSLNPTTTKRPEFSNFSWMFLNPNNFFQFEF